MDTDARYRRLLQGVAGAAFVAVGLSGLSWTWQAAPVFAQSSDRDSHTTMHEMMDVMHGEGTGARMHKVEGTEEMMDTCASMMDTMGGMSGMDSMMDGGMSGMRSNGMSGNGLMMGSG